MVSTPLSDRAARQRRGCEAPCLAVKLTRTPLGAEALLLFALLALQIAPAGGWALPSPRAFLTRCLSPVWSGGCGAGLLWGKCIARRISMPTPVPAGEARCLLAKDRDELFAFLDGEASKGSGAATVMRFRAGDFGDVWAEQECWYADAARWEDVGAVLSVNQSGSYVLLAARNEQRASGIVAAVSAEGRISWALTMFATLDEVPPPAPPPTSTPPPRAER